MVYTHIDLVVRDMEIIVKCGSESCRKEFKARTNEPEWVCPNCERIIVNKNYPFLTARLMEAKSNPDKANWKLLHDELLEKAAGIIREKDKEIEILAKKVKNLEKKNK